MKNFCKTITKNGKRCKKYKQKNYNTCSVHKPKEECIICLNNINNNIQKTLHCNHTYCLDCISKWIYLEEKNTCPLCRNFINEIEQYDAFEYCLQSKIITKYISYELYIKNEELKLFLDDIIVPGSIYDHIEWIMIINYINESTDKLYLLYLLFLNSQIYNYISYRLFDEYQQGVNNVVYEYSIYFI
jgi:hypothetical protein